MDGHSAMMMMPVLVPAPHPTLSRVEPVCDNLPAVVEEGGLSAIDVTLIRRFWHHFCPHGDEMNHRCTKREATRRQPYLKEFSCCGSATLCCQLHCGEIVFSMRGQHRGLYMEPPRPFTLKLKRAAQSQLQGPSRHLQQMQKVHHQHEQQQMDEEGTGLQEKKVEEDHAHETLMSSPAIDLRNGADNDDGSDRHLRVGLAIDGGPAGTGADPRIDSGHSRPALETTPTTIKVDITVIPFFPKHGAGEDAEHGSRRGSGNSNNNNNSPAIASSPPQEPTFDEVRTQLVEAFASQGARDHLEALTLNRKNARVVVRIGGMRFEVFLGPKRSRAFYEVLRLHEPLMEWLKDRNKAVEWMRDRLLEEMDTYVLTKDPRMQTLIMSRGGIPYERQVYSLLISYGSVPAQSLHIDMAYPLYQGVMLLTPSPPTHVFPVQNVLNRSVEKLEVEDFVDLLCRRSTSHVSDGARQDMIQAIRRVPGAVLLVERYGWLFASTDTKMSAHHDATERMPGQGTPFCGYLGLPGSVIHRGPSCDDVPRLTLFAAYGQASDEPYNPSVQYTAPVLHAMLADWILDGMTSAEARWTFLRVGRQLLAEDDAGPADFMQYGADCSRWAPSEVSGGQLLATAQARFVEKLREDLELLGSDKQAFYKKYIE